MTSNTLVHLPHGRLAIRTVTPAGEVLLLAVPRMRDDIPRAARRRVFEYVLRRQVGLAEATAQIEADVVEGRLRADKRLASLIAEAPHATARDHGLAA